VQAGLLSREIKGSGVPTPLTEAEGNIAGGAIRESSADPARSKNLCMHGISMRENREIPRSPAHLIMGRAARGRPRL
jgi:RNA-directed DNA polymerase